jgi:apolipoprotein N-acyltransferase
MSRSERRKAALAILSGVLTALAMPGFGLGPLVFLALVPLFFALEGRRRLVYGLLFGAVFFALDLRWVLTLQRFSPLVVPGFFLLVLYQSLFCGLFALLLVRPRTPGAALFLGAPAAFTLLEFARAQGPLGNGFSAVYQSLYHAPWLIQAASAFGPWAITALIVATNVAIYLAIRRKRVAYLIAGGGAVAALAAFSLLPIQLASGDPIRVAAVSSNVRQETKLDARNLNELTDRYLDLGRLALAEDPDLVVFPESILPAYILRDEVSLGRLRDLAAAGNARILFGTGDYRDHRIFNEVALLSQDGDLIGTYAMVRPVPFGEYVPARRLWEAIGLRSLIDSFLPVDLTPGRGFDPIEGVGTPICFESTFPGPARQLVRNGAEILAVVTNDAWFVGSSELAAHFAAAIFRAVETRRYLIQAANGGVSGIVDPRGRIVAETDGEEIVRGTASLRDGRTLYSRWGDVPLMSLLGVAGLVFVFARLRGRRTRSGG